MWREVKRCDERGRALADGHYSRQTPGAAEFMPPGRTLVLIAEGAVWGSSRNRFGGVERSRCAIFRNVGPLRSSDLIREATARTYARWPDLRLRTEVDPSKVKAKRHPGYAFRCAGWVTLGTVRKRKRGGGSLIILQAPPPNALDERGELL